MSTNKVSKNIKTLLNKHKLYKDVSIKLNKVKKLLKFDRKKVLTIINSEKKPFLDLSQSPKEVENE